jgi:hypothetical protein
MNNNFSYFKKINKNYLVFFFNNKKYKNIFNKSFNKFLRVKYSNLLHFNTYFVNKKLGLFTKNITGQKNENNFFLNV